MAYEKKYVVLYSYYEMISSYFASYNVVSKYPEDRLLMHFKDASKDFQFSCEDYCIYSIEKVLPKFLKNYKLDDYEAKFKFDIENSSLLVLTKDFCFTVIADYVKGKPSILYKDFKHKKK